ncbi:RNI-like protein [Wallemia mellicola]|nr:RNI-like protein [Wallemia mellicola]
MKRKNFNIEPSNRSKSNKSTKIDDDILMRLWINASQEPSSNLSATRYVPPLRAPTLKELSISIVVDKFKQLYESSRDTFVESFRRLPDFDRETLGDAIMTKYADLMSITLIRELFILPPSIKLDHSLPSLSRQHYPKLLRELPGGLTTLDLTGFSELSDKSGPQFVRKSPHLRTLKLRGCLSIGESSIDAIKMLSELEHLDVSFTAIPLAGLSKVLSNCVKLKRLDINATGKVGSKNTAQWDQMLDSVISSSVNANLQPLSQLEHLNVAECNISDAALGRWLTLAPSMKVLNCSNCESLSNPMLFLPPNLYNQLVKIDISFMSLDLFSFNAFYQEILKSSSIKVLWMSGMMRKASASDNEFLLVDGRLTPTENTLEGFAPEELEWSNNPRLKGSQCLSYHITSKLKYLNLSGSTFDGAAFNDAIMANDPRCLENLQLNECNIDANVVAGITKLKGLKTLGLMKTKIDEESLNEIIKCSPLLSSLNITQCRAIPVVNRRRYFEYYDERE